MSYQSESIPKNTTRREIFDGLRDAMPVTVASSSFGILFGALAIKSGLDIWQTIFASATIFAGASQFVFLELYALKVPGWSILLSVLALNFRHVLYSASLGRKMQHFSFLQRYGTFFFMVDPMFGSAEDRAQSHGLTPSYIISYGLLMYLSWILFTAMGAWFGALIEDPNQFGLDLLMPIFFLTLVMGFRKRPNWLPVVCASGVVSVVVYWLLGPPWHISIGALAGILLAVIIGKPEEQALGDDHG